MGLSQGTLEKNLTEPIHRIRHLFLVIRDRTMDFMEWFANLLANVPANGRASDSSCQTIQPR